MDAWRKILGVKVFYRLGNLEVYPPSEDSILLARFVKERAKGYVLDLGTGSGIQGIIAAKKKCVEQVMAVDVDEDAIKIAKKNAELNGVSEKMKFEISNLFEAVSGEFDTIIFNPPYLPEEGWEDEKTKRWTVGGPTGKEIIIEFLEQSVNYLKEDGEILMVFSSLSDPFEIGRVATSLGYRVKELAREHYFFEDLIVYSIRWRR